MPQHFYWNGLNWEFICLSSISAFVVSWNNISNIYKPFIWGIFLKIRFIKSDLFIDSKLQTFNIRSDVPEHFYWNVKYFLFWVCLSRITILCISSEERTVCFNIVHSSQWISSWDTENASNSWHHDTVHIQLNTANHVSCSYHGYMVICLSYSCIWQHWVTGTGGRYVWRFSIGSRPVPLFGN